MRLATRTGLAAFAAASVSLLAIGAVVQTQFGRVLRERVDAQLEDRADTAPILAAVGVRLAASELSGTVGGARVLADGVTTDLGLLPSEPLPPVDAPGWSTASADGERWRLLTIAVADVPAPGDQALVQLAAPLGDVDAQARTLRRRGLVVALVAAAVAGLVGYLLGLVATRPLSALRRDTDRLDDADPSRWRVADRYGSPEVDDVATTLNQNLERLAEETVRRGAALDSARAFAASATHELRTPLQSALTNLDIARSGKVDDAERIELVAVAHQQLRRLADSLAAVRSLADAELTDPSWFEPTDLAELADAVVAEEARRGGTGGPVVEVVVPAGARPGPVPIWRDGARLAVANVVRNALAHGRPVDGSGGRVTVTVDGPVVVVDDDGPGIPLHERARVLGRFERGAGPASGSGLGLAITAQVVAAHGGTVVVGESPSGGCRIRLSFTPGPPVVTSPPAAAPATA